jgi:hypothetical protein
MHNSLTTTEKTMPIDWTKDPNLDKSLDKDGKLQYIADANDEIAAMKRAGVDRDTTKKLEELTMKWYSRWQMENTDRDVRYNNPAN